MVVGINCGHTLSGPGSGANGIIRESAHTRLIGHALMRRLKDAGVSVMDCTIDEAGTQAAYLARAVELANRRDLDWFISIHLNASAAHTGHGVEVYTYEGRQYQDALDVCENLSRLGFANRGVKDGSGLYVIRKTKAKSMLIEVCFCDHARDVAAYQASGPDKTAGAICDALIDYVATDDVFARQTQLLASMSNEEFVEWIGVRAAEDMRRSGILASVTAAQAILESGYGKSELALKALNLGGMKAGLSGSTWPSAWDGRVYPKRTAEQNQDGSYNSIMANFRKYGSVEEYLRDHSDYLRGAKNKNGLRYEGIAGCRDYRRAFTILKNGGYASSHDYVENLCRVAERWDLTRFDTLTKADEAAPEGYAYVVRAGLYKQSRKAAEELAHRLAGMGVLTEVALYKVEERIET